MGGREQRAEPNDAASPHTPAIQELQAQVMHLSTKITKVVQFIDEHLATSSGLPNRVGRTYPAPPPRTCQQHLLQVPAVPRASTRAPKCPAWHVGTVESCGRSSFYSHSLFLRTRCGHSWTRACCMLATLVGIRQRSCGVDIVLMGDRNLWLPGLVEGRGARSADRACWNFTCNVTVFRFGGCEPTWCSDTRARSGIGFGCRTTWVSAECSGFFFFTHLFEAVDAVPVQPEQPELQPTAGFGQRVRLAPGDACWSGGGCPAHPRGFHAVPAPHPRRRPHQRVGARAEKPRRLASQQQRASQTTSAPSQHAQPLAAVPRRWRHGVEPRGAGRRQLQCWSARQSRVRRAAPVWRPGALGRFGAVCVWLRPARRLRGGCPRQAARSQFGWPGWLSWRRSRAGSY